jgi:hypothetical protein
MLSAMSASDRPVHGCPPRNDNHNLPHLTGKAESGRKKEAEGFCMRKMKKRPLADFWTNQLG